jgi:ABC-2 type transport system ATP-binding protein
VVLTLEHVSKKYGKSEAVSDVSFTVPRGKVVGFVGANGAGKTTTLKAILNFHRIDSGKITIFGKPHTDKTCRRYLGFLPERPYFYDGLTAREFLRFYGSLSGFAGRAADARIEELLKLVGLPDVGSKLLREFSKGMTQRMGIAQAMIHGPELLILDEPVSGLDPVGRMDVQKLLQNLKDEGRTIFFSSHILPDVEAICDDVILIHQGKLVLNTTGEQVLRTAVKYYEWIVEGAPLQKCQKEMTHARFIGNNGDSVAVHFESAPDAETHAMVQKLGARVRSITPVRDRLEDVMFRLSRGDKEKIW